MQMVMAMMVLAYRGVMGRYQGSEHRRTEGQRPPEEAVTHGWMK